MSEAPLMPAPKTPKDNTDRDIARLVNAGLMPRNKLPLLRAARKNLARKGDIAFIPRMQRRAIQDYQDALQTAALKTTGSVSAVRRNINAGVELEGEVISEEMLVEDAFQPPPMMTLRRTGIRIFPDGRRVALYVSNRYNLMFSVPYKANMGPENIPMVQSEETESEEIMENLDQVAKYAQEESPKQTSKHMKFADGSKMRVSHGAAKAIHMVHGALNSENKKKFADMLTDPKGFEKAANFALSRVKFEINK